MSTLRYIMAILSYPYYFLKVTGWTGVCVFFQFMFSWVRCPWCQTWFPYTGHHGECRHCGRKG